MDETTFEADRKRLIDRYLAEAPPDGEECNKDSGEAIFTLILEAERLRHCVRAEKLKELRELERVLRVCTASVKVKVF